MVHQLHHLRMAVLELRYRIAQLLHVFVHRLGGRAWRGQSLRRQLRGLGAQLRHEREQFRARLGREVRGRVQARFDLADGFFDHNQVLNCPSLLRNKMLKVVMEP